MGEKIRYLKDELDFTIEDNHFLFFEKGHLVAEGTISIKDNNAAVSNPVLKDGRTIDSIWIDDEQMIVSVSSKMIQLKKMIRPVTFNDLLKDYQGTFENMLFDLKANLADNRITIDFQGKHFEGEVDVIRKNEYYILINHECLYDGKPLPMGDFDSFVMLDGALVLFTNENDSAQGRITLRRY